MPLGSSSNRGCHGPRARRIGAVLALLAAAATTAAREGVGGSQGSADASGSPSPPSPLPSPASAPTIALDANRSRADFEVKVLWLIGVHGRFGRVQGEVAIDRFRSTAVADAIIGVDAITMRNRTYEDWVKSAEFFDAQHYPQIHFVSDPLPLERLRAGGEITGALTVRGVTRPVALQIAPSACPQAIAIACPVEATGTIRRSDFGMRSRRGTLSDKVELGFSIFLADTLPAPGRAR